MNYIFLYFSSLTFGKANHNYNFGRYFKSSLFCKYYFIQELVSRTILVQRREWVKYGWRSQMLNNNRLKRFKQQQQQLYINDTMFIKLLRIHERRTYCLLWHELQFFQTDDLFLFNSQCSENIYQQLIRYMRGPEQMKQKCWNLCNL